MKSAKNNFEGSISLYTSESNPSSRKISTMTGLNTSGKEEPKSIFISSWLRALSVGCWVEDWGLVDEDGLP